MGLLYLNIVNTLLSSQKYNNSLVFSIVSKTKSKSKTKTKSKTKKKSENSKSLISSNSKYDNLCYISLIDLIKYLNVKSNIIFKQPKDNFIETFNVIVDGQERIINISSIICLSKHIIKFIDNRDLPINNNKRMHHSPFIIYNNYNIKFPKSSILNFDNNCKLITDWEILKNSDEKHDNYNLITPYNPSLTHIDLSLPISTLSFNPSHLDISIFKSLLYQ